MESHYSSQGVARSIRTNSKNVALKRNNSFYRHVKALDMFPKLESDFSVKTDTGGCVTLFSVVLILVLSLAELWTWVGINQEIKEHVTVHNRLDKVLHVRMNISFPAMACKDIIAETIDIGGDSKPIDELVRISVGEGCNLSGDFDVNRVGGVFHFHADLGREIEWSQIQNQTVSSDAMHFNSSHTIHEFSFGPDYNAMPKSTLEGVERLAMHETGLFMYFCELVPTTFLGEELVRSLLAESSTREEPEATTGYVDPALDTVLYTFTHKFEPFLVARSRETERRTSDAEPDVDTDKEVSTDPGAENSRNHHAHDAVKELVLPGVFFQYELIPFSVQVTKSSSPVTHLLIRLLATIGGVLTIASLVDGVFHSTSKKFLRHK